MSAIASFHGIRYFDIQIPAGFPSPGADYAEKRIDLNDAFIQHPLSTYIVAMADESMKDAYIPCKAKLLIDKSLQVRSGDIVAATCSGDFTVRFLEKRGKTYWLIPANKDFQPVEVAAGLDTIISGVVTRIFIEPNDIKSSGLKPLKGRQFSANYLQKKIDLNKIFNKRPLSSFMISTVGNSMNGAFIPDKSKLFIDKSLEARTGDIVVAMYNRGFTVKYLELNEKGCRLLPANNRYQPIEITEEMQMQVWGVAFLIIIDPKDIKHVCPR